MRTIISVGTALALAAASASAQEKELTFGELLARLPASVAHELDEQISQTQADKFSAPGSVERRVRLEQFRAQKQRPEPSTIRVTGTVTAAARCATGFVAEGRVRASAPDVQILSEQRVDCDGRQCRAFQVTARRDSDVPFDLDVSVTCTAL